MGNTISRRSSKVGLVLSLTLVFGLLLGVLPASASATATASVNIHSVLAGQTGKLFTLNVTNAENALVGGKTINRILITPPIEMIDAVSGVAPANWTAETFGSDPTIVRFKPASGNAGLAPGGSLSLGIISDIRSTVSRDVGDTWLVRVSGDGGITTLKATAAGEGLTTTLRVLQAQSVGVVSPALAADDRDNDGNPEVTGTQSGICIRTSVFNASANALSVTPDLDPSQASHATVGPARPATPGADCTGAPLPEGDPTIPGGEAEIPGRTASSFDFLVSFGDVGSKTNTEFTASAAAPGSSTAPTSDPDDDVLITKRIVVIEPKAALSYVTDSLTPRAVVPSDLTANPPFENRKSFSIRINKGPAGSPPLQPVGGDFQSAFCNANLVSPTDFPGGAANNQTANFQECVIADLDDGRYQPTIRMGYTDGNGLVQGLTALSGVEKVRLDSLIPNVLPNIPEPASRVQAVPPVRGAVNSGQPFSVNGTVTDTSPDTGQPTACGPNPKGSTAPLPCTLVKAELLQYTGPDGTGTLLGDRITVTPSCSLSSSGNLTCNITTTFAVGTQSTRIEVHVVDETENPGKGLSNAVDVDLIDPCLGETCPATVGGLVTRGPGVDSQRRAVTVRMSEPVQNATNSNSPTDWSVQDGTVRPVIAAVQPADKRSVSLTTLTDFDVDVPGGTVTYAPKIGSSPYHDRVGRTVAVPVTKTLRDGIEPLAPDFLRINGQAAQPDGGQNKFFFNTLTPTVELNSTNPDDPAIRDMYDAEVWMETNLQPGLQRPGDTRVCLDTSDGSDSDPNTVGLSMLLDSCEFKAGEGEYDIYGVTIDINGNVGRIKTAIAVLDLTRPIFKAATIAGNTISVTFSETLSDHGRNAGEDWHFFATRIADGKRKEFNVANIAGAISDTRTMTIEDEEYNASYKAHSVRYLFKGEPGQRYRDRAGNEMLDIPEGLITAGA